MIQHHLQWTTIRTVIKTAINNTVNKTANSTLITALTLSTSLNFFWVVFNTQNATAATFSHQENRAIAVDPTQVSRSVEGNVLTAENAAILTNTSDRTTPNTIYTIPFLFANVDGTPITLGWENQADAYINENYDGLGNQLKIAIANFTGRVRLGNVADITGQAPLPLTIPCNTSPSCPPPAPFPLPVAAQDADDEIPFFNLGSFASSETKAIDAVLAFSYEDSRTGVLPTLTTFSVLSETGQAVPEPGAIAALLFAASTLAASTPKIASNSKEDT